MNLALPCFSTTLVIAAFIVVFLWTTYAIVTIFRLGFFLSNFFLLISSSYCRFASQWLYGLFEFLSLQHKANCNPGKSPGAGLNRRPRPYQGRALPTELPGHIRR